jgi:hypothetical protein
MAFTFHNSYVILELVPSTELTCRSKSYSNKTTMLLGWSHRYKNYMVIITIWLTAMKYPYVKWQWIFYNSQRFFFSLSLQGFWSYIVLDCIYYMINTAVSYKKQELLTFREHQSSPPVAHLLIFFIWFDLVFNATFSNISATVYHGNQL